MELINRGVSRKEDMMKMAVENPFAAIIALGGLSFYEFLQAFWNEVNNDEFKTNWHIEFLCSELEQILENVGKRLPKENDLLINVPPGTTKTMICSIFFPVYAWTKYSWIDFITGSYSSDLALENAEKSRTIMRSDKFRMLYPDLELREDKDKKSNYQVVTALRGRNGAIVRYIYGGSRLSTSVGGTITGFHGHINIWDDPINPKQAASEIMLKTANDWVDQSASTRKKDKDITTTILIMQRLHQDDPSGHLLEKKDKKIKHICLPGEIVNYREMVSPNHLISKYVDGLLDPRRLSWGALKELESDLGQYGYAGQIGQSPTPPGGGMFKIDRFQFIQNLPTSIHFISIIRYWDKAGTKDGGKRTAGVKIGRLTNNRFIVMDVRLGQWSTDERERIIKATAVADGRDVEIYIEQEPGSGGKESKENTIRNLIGFVCRPDLPKGDKITRADPYSVQVNEGNILLLNGLWNKDFIEEHKYFPFGKFKDQVDASAAGFNILAGKRIAGRIT